MDKATTRNVAHASIQSAHSLGMASRQAPFFLWAWPPVEGEQNPYRRRFLISGGQWQLLVAYRRTTRRNAEQQFPAMQRRLPRVDLSLSSIKAAWRRLTEPQEFRSNLRIISQHATSHRVPASRYIEMAYQRTETVIQ